MITLKDSLDMGSIEAITSIQRRRRWSPEEKRTRGCFPRGRRECRWGIEGCEDRWDGGAQSGGTEGVGSRLLALDLTASE